VIGSQGLGTLLFIDGWKIPKSTVFGELIPGCLPLTSTPAPTHPLLPLPCANLLARTRSDPYTRLSASSSRYLHQPPSTLAMWLTFQSDHAPHRDPPDPPPPPTKRPPTYPPPPRFYAPPPPDAPVVRCNFPPPQYPLLPLCLLRTT